MIVLLTDRWPDGLTNGQGESDGDNIQNVLPLTSDPVLMAKNDAHYFIYIYMYITHRKPRISMLTHTSLDSTDDIAV